MRQFHNLAELFAYREECRCRISEENGMEDFIAIDYLYDHAKAAVRSYFAQPTIDPACNRMDWMKDNGAFNIVFGGAIGLITAKSQCGDLRKQGRWSCELVKIHPNKIMFQLKTARGAVFMQSRHLTYAFRRDILKEFANATV